MLLKSCRKRIAINRKTSEADRGLTKAILTTMAEQTLNVLPALPVSVSPTDVTGRAGLIQVTGCAHRSVSATQGLASNLVHEVETSPNDNKHMVEEVLTKLPERTSQSVGLGTERLRGDLIDVSKYLMVCLPTSYGYCMEQMLFPSGADIRTDKAIL